MCITNNIWLLIIDSCVIYVHAYILHDELRSKGDAIYVTRIFKYLATSNRRLWTTIPLSLHHDLYFAQFIVPQIASQIDYIWCYLQVYTGTNNHHYIFYQTNPLARMHWKCIINTDRTPESIVKLNRIGTWQLYALLRLVTISH